jgi:hypothetical protein
MKKRRPIGIFDLGRIPVTPPLVQREAGIGKPYQFRADEAQREKESADRLQNAIAEKQAEGSRIMKECLEVSAPLKAKFWSQPIDNLKTRLRDEDAFDELFLEKSDEDVDSNEIYDKVLAFCNDIPTLEDEDERKFNLYVACQVLNNVVINDLSLRMMFDRCLSLGLFKGIVEPQIPTPARRPVQQEEPVEQSSRATMDDLMNVDAETRDGRRRAHNVVQELYLLDEMRPLMTEWVTSIQRQYGFSPTDEDLKRIGRWFERNNFSFLDPRNYDAARRWMCASGYWDSSLCLMEIEKFQLALESIDTSRLTPQQRNELNRRELHAREADARRFAQ